MEPTETKIAPQILFIAHREILEEIIINMLVSLTLNSIYKELQNKIAIVEAMIMLEGKL